VGAGAAAVIERQLNGFMGQVVGRDGHLGDATHRANYTLTTFISDLWGPGREWAHQQVAKVHRHITKQINNEITCQLYLDTPT
jgi:hypothetical protein